MGLIQGYLRFVFEFTLFFGCWVAIYALFRLIPPPLVPDDGLYAGSMCAIRCMQIVLNWQGAILPILLAALLSPIAAMGFVVKLSRLPALVTAATVCLTLTELALSQPVTIVSGFVGYGIGQAEEALAVALTFVWIWCWYHTGGPSWAHSKGQVIGAAAFAFCTWVLVSIWVDLIILPSALAKGATLDIIGGAGLADGVFDYPAIFALTLIIWVAALPRLKRLSPRLFESGTA